MSFKGSKSEPLGGMFPRMCCKMDSVSTRGKDGCWVDWPSHLGWGHCQKPSPGQAWSPLSRMLCGQSLVSLRPRNVCISFILTRPAGSSGSPTQAEKKAELLGVSGTEQPEPGLL